jgi:hypothetical protein
MERSHSWHANSRSATQEILYRLWNLYFLRPILISSYLWLGFSNDLFPTTFITESMNVSRISHACYVPVPFSLIYQRNNVDLGRGVKFKKRFIMLTVAFCRCCLGHCPLVEVFLSDRTLRKSILFLFLILQFSVSFFYFVILLVTVELKPGAFWIRR